MVFVSGINCNLNLENYLEVICGGDRAIVLGSLLIHGIDDLCVSVGSQLGLEGDVEFGRFVFWIGQFWWTHGVGFWNACFERSVLSKE